MASFRLHPRARTRLHHSASRSVTNITCTRRWDPRMDTRSRMRVNQRVKGETGEVYSPG